VAFRRLVDLLRQPVAMDLGALLAAGDALAGDDASWGAPAAEFRLAWPAQRRALEEGRAAVQKIIAIAREAPGWYYWHFSPEEIGPGYRDIASLLSEPQESPPGRSTTGDSHSTLKDSGHVAIH
jgi:hypothetical protein